MKVPSELNSRVPFPGPSVSDAVSESPSTSLSLASRFPVSELSSLMLKMSSPATGASLTGLMVMDTVATELVAVPSSAT